jgi:hypothetical protein
VHVRAAHEARLARGYGVWGAAAAVVGSGWLVGAWLLFPPRSDNPRVRAALAFEGVVSPVFAVGGIVSVLASVVLLRRAEEHDKAAAAIWGATPGAR